MHVPHFVLEDDKHYYDFCAGKIYKKYKWQGNIISEYVKLCNTGYMTIWINGKHHKQHRIL